ncbi:MAG TPA: hypothetical protein VNQ99_17705 [Xanthobacteraceae bacterium]|nr:hypothetical protein [Xanthobacteraceae bacterium]
MSLGRFAPNSREVPEETKRRIWREYGWIIIDTTRDNISWELMIWIKQWAANRWGPRRETK